MGSWEKFMKEMDKEADAVYEATTKKKKSEEDVADSKKRYTSLDPASNLTGITGKFGDRVLPLSGIKESAVSSSSTLAGSPTGEQAYGPHIFGKKKSKKKVDKPKDKSGI